MTDTPAQTQAQAKALAPGATIGIIGGGQLGRMTALAAANLGFKCHIFTPERNSPAEQVAATATVAAYDDEAALAAFADAVDVVTFEFENIPFESVELLSRHRPVRPHWDCLRISQDRVVEKEFLNSLGAETAPWKGPLTSVADLEAAVAGIGRPAVLKSTRLGYDGKGQARIDADTDLAAAWAEMGADEAVLEGFVAFEREVSVVIARGLDGATAAFDVVENVHKNHILDITRAPAAIAAALADEARALAARIVTEMGLVGLLAIEMFVTADGKLLVNEVAPRPHNSGHWTQDACVTSQFEQFVRAVTGLPLGSPERLFDAEMTNLIGDDVEAWPDIVNEPGAHLHLYGKAEARPGRKMGHVNRLFPKTSA